MKETTILVTDSGLGGMSVFAGLASGLAGDARYDRIRLIYFNAWPSQYKGYNHYENMTERAAVFHNAMAAMAAFEPDRILIACNTLSVIYPFTAFAKAPQIPVTGIIDNGVDMIAEELSADPASKVIIFGTPATVEAGTHETALVNRGIAADRIIGQPCLNLAGRIEREPFGRETMDLIAQYTQEAAQKLSGSETTVFAALCCTHFGYCQTQFFQGLSARSNARIEIINPNTGMIQRALEGARPGGTPAMDLEVYSRVILDEARIQAYEQLLSATPKVAEALACYTLDRELFNIDLNG